MRLFALPLVLLALPGLAGEPDLTILEQAGRWKELRTRVQPWVQASPQDPMALVWSARLKARSGDMEGALTQARAALALAPKHVEVMSCTAMMLGQMAGSSTSKLKQFSLAREMKKLGEQVLELHPAHPDTTDLMAKFYRMAPGIIGGDNKKAWAIAQQLAEKDPAAGYDLLADLAQMDKDPAKAVAYWRQGIALAKDPYRPLIALANHLVGEKGEAEVPGLLKQAMALHPDWESAHSLQAYWHAKQGDFGALDKELAAWEKMNADNLFPHFWAASALLRANKELGRAEALFRRFMDQAFEVGPFIQANASKNLGLVLEKQGRKAEAIAALEAAVKLNPNSKSAAAELKRMKQG